MWRRDLRCEGGGFLSDRFIVPLYDLAAGGPVYIDAVAGTAVEVENDALFDDELGARQEADPVGSRPGPIDREVAQADDVRRACIDNDPICIGDLYLPPTKGAESQALPR